MESIWNLHSINTVENPSLIRFHAIFIPAGKQREWVVLFSCSSELSPLIKADVSPQGRWKEAAPRYDITHCVSAQTCTQGLISGSAPRGPPRISCAKISLLKLNRLELIFILVISKGLSWIRGCRGTLCWAWMFIPGPLWGGTQINGGDGHVMEDESKLWTFILPDSIISSGASSKICKLTWGGSGSFSSVKTVYTTI